MSQLVVPLSEIRRGDVARVGGKTALLGELRAAGFPVPDGLCLTTEAFRRRARSEIAEALQASLNTLGDGPLAVRSSATDEDQADRSMAGAYTSVLGVRGLDAVLDAVQTVWRSLGDSRAEMGVLVMPLVEAECSGVAFTIDPVRQDADIAVVEAAWGLGPGTVDGSVATDAYWLRRSSLETEDKRVVEKSSQVVLGDGGLKSAPVPEDRRKARVLPGPWLGRVAQVSLMAEALLGAPQDVEWAIAGGDKPRLWVLQSRPITTLPVAMRAVEGFPVEWADTAERAFAWSADWISRRRPLQPLENDVLLASIENGDQLTRLWNGARKMNRIKRVRGRSFWTRVDTPLHAGDRRVRERAGEDLVVRLREAGSTPWEHYAPEVVTATRRLDSALVSVDASDGTKIAELFEDAHGLYTRHWAVHWMVFQNEKAIVPLNEAVEAATGSPKEEAAEIGAKLIEGEETVLTRLIDGLYDLAVLARGDAVLAGMLTGSKHAIAAESADAHVQAAFEDLPVREPSAQAVREQVESLAGEDRFRARLVALLGEYGDRIGSGYGSDISLHTPTWREDPRQLLALTAPYLDREVEAPSVRRERARVTRDAWLDQLCARCDAEKAEALRRAVALGRRIATDLEEHNHYIDQLTFGQLRRAQRLAATWLVDRGAIARRDDVYWLQLDELLETLRSETPTPLYERVVERRAQAQEWARETPPHSIGTPDPTLEKRPPLKDDLTEGAPPGARLLRGTAASAGRHRGRARIAKMSETLPGVGHGEVLVAENAGPQWTPLFPILGAIVLDSGALTQHAATTAREYGVPCVLQTGNATSRIRDGDWVLVDGTAGTVEIDQG